MCGRDIDSHQGLKAHYKTCEIMSMSYNELIEMQEKFSAGDDDLAQLMNLHSITEVFQQELSKRIQYQLQGSTNFSSNNDDILMKGNFEKFNIFRGNQRLRASIDGKASQLQ
jgi:hypothetical protein